MDSVDLVLLPVYIALIYFIASQIKSRHLTDPVYQKYYIKGLHYKIGGTIGFALIYIFYYKGGDSINYFLAAKPLYKLAFTYPDRYWEFIFHSNYPYPYECRYEVNSYGVGFLLRSNTTVMVIRFTSVVNLFCFNSYILCCIVTSFISYIFVFKAFRLLVGIYPSLVQQFSIAFLMIPSVIFWGSGVGKDVIMFSSIMFIFVRFYEAAILKRSIAMNVFKILVAAYLVSLVRGFIIITLAPCLILMAAVYYRNVFRNPVVRFVALPLFLVVGMAASYLFIQSIGHTMQSYNLDSMEKTAEGFKSWHTTLGETEGGSFYSLGGDFDYTIAGIIRKAPLALAITLFGPFIWQIRNAVMLMSGLESFIFLFFFIKVFLNMRAYRALGIIFKDHVIVFCAVFVVIIGVAVGLTSFNYGALVRYKIPVLPFFAVLIAITQYRINTPQK